MKKPAVLLIGIRTGKSDCPIPFERKYRMSLYFPETDKILVDDVLEDIQSRKNICGHYFELLSVSTKMNVCSEVEKAFGLAREMGYRVVVVIDGCYVSTSEHVIKSCQVVEDVILNIVWQKIERRGELRQPYRDISSQVIDNKVALSY
jgi:hypothetical protein